eukprot:3437762-Prymnesium_polylepis.1
MAGSICRHTVGLHAAATRCPPSSPLAACHAVVGSCMVGSALAASRTLACAAHGSGSSLRTASTKQILQVRFRRRTVGTSRQMVLIVPFFFFPM